MSSNHIKEWRDAVRKQRHGVFINRDLIRSEESKWSPPVEGQYKINVDASVFQGMDSYSVGLVMRDHEGKFLEGRNMRIAGSVSVLEAEAVGI